MSKDTKDNTFLLGSEWWLAVPDRTWGKRPPTLPMRRGNLGSGVWESWLVTHWSCPLSKKNKISPTYPTSIGFPSVLGNFPFAKPMPDWGLTLWTTHILKCMPFGQACFQYSRYSTFFNQRLAQSEFRWGKCRSNFLVFAGDLSSELCFRSNIFGWLSRWGRLRSRQPQTQGDDNIYDNHDNHDILWKKIVDMGALGVPSLQMSWDVEDLWWFSMTCTYINASQNRI